MSKAYPNPPEGAEAFLNVFINNFKIFNLINRKGAIKGSPYLRMSGPRARNSSGGQLL